MSNIELLEEMKKLSSTKTHSEDLPDTVDGISGQDEVAGNLKRFRKHCTQVQIALKE